MAVKAPTRELPGEGTAVLLKPGLQASRCRMCDRIRDGVTLTHLRKPYYGRRTENSVVLSPRPRLSATG